MPNTFNSRQFVLGALFAGLAGVGFAQESALPDMNEIVAAYQSGDFETAREGLRILAEQEGSALSYYRYGRILYEGLGGPQDLTQAAEHLEMAVAQHHLEAAVLLGKLYLENGTEDTLSRAVSLLSNGAARGNSDAQYLMSELYVQGYGVEQNSETALTWLMASAEQGHPVAQFDLSRYFANGIGTAPDQAAAFEWLSQSAENGYARAQYFMGVNYENGTSVPPNAAQAIVWFQRAAESGDALAQRVLGTKYLTGDGIPENPDEALRLLTLAAEAGEPGAQSNLGYLYSTGTIVDADPEQAFLWYERAAAAGLTRAALALATFYETGTGIEQDLKEAALLYQEVFSAGDDTGGARLGAMIATGTVPDDVHVIDPMLMVYLAANAGSDDAVNWMLERVDLGDMRATAMLATHYLDHAQNLDEAIPLLEQAALYNNGTAQMRLGELYTTGTGVPLDMVMAYKWLNLAATFGRDEAREKRDLLTQLMTPEQIAEAQSLTRAHLANDQPMPPDTDQTVDVQ